MVTWGWTTALEGKEPGCGSGWRDRPGTEGTTVGQPTQGREWCFIGLEAAGYPASRHGDFPLRRGVMFIICFYSFKIDDAGLDAGCRREGTELRGWLWGQAGY